MSGSDSEAFESADESFEEEVEKKNRNKLNIDVEKKVYKLNKKIIEFEKSNYKETKQESNISDNTIETKQFIDFSTTLNNNKNTDTEQQSETVDDAINQDDGWDIDDWGEEEDYDLNNKILTSSSNRKTDQISSEVSLTKSTDDNFKIASQIKKLDHEKFSGTNLNESEPTFSGVFDKLSKEHESTSWGWKPWGGVVSFISSATEGVASLTTNVSKGLSNVIESGIGVPDPEDFAKRQKEELQKIKENHPDILDTEDEFKKEDKFRSIVSGVTQISNRVLTGGLDTLEGIGKKTMNILQENDHGLLNKRKFLGMDNERPVLSQVLREAKEKTEENERNLKLIQKHLYKKQLHFETLFDDYNGLVHLEALEMLSKQSSLKLQSLLTPLTGKALQEMQETLSEVNELCELPEQDDDIDGHHSVEELSQKLCMAVEDLDILVDFKEILNCWEITIYYLNNDSDEFTPMQIHDKALHCLAQTSALAVQKMHKLAEVLLVLDHHSTANEADSLVQLTTIFCWHLSGIATRFSNKISDNKIPDNTNTLITSIFLEGNNSTSYIQKTFQLFVPILQFGAA